MSNGLISFRQIRKTASIVKQFLSSGYNDEQLTKVLWTGLLPSVESSNEQIRIRVKLAILELQRLSGLDLDIASTLDTLADESYEGRFAIFKNVFSEEFSSDEMISLIDWLIRRIGSQASSALTAKERVNRRQHRKAGEQAQHQMTFESAAVLLDCICRLTKVSFPHISPSYFNVIALDGYVKANKDDEVLMQSCCQFSSLLSLTTKLELLSGDFARRQRHLERERMFANIYAGRDIHHDSNGETSNRKCLEINRSNILNDSKQLLDETKGSLSDGIHIRFIGEEGQDAGGLLKEWLLLLCKELVPLVFCQAEKEATKSEICVDCSTTIANLMGIVIGLSIRYRIPLDIALPDYIYRYIFTRLASDKPILNDLGQVRPTLTKGLTEMLSWDEEGFSQRLSLNFTYQPRFEGEAVPLVPNGDKVAVTHSNRDAYVNKICSYILQEQSQQQLQALQYGLEQVCHDLQSLQLFSIDEIDGLVCGQEIPLDVASLRRISAVDPSSRSDNYIDDFWSVLEQANDVDILRRLLHFVTANHRIPLTLSNSESNIIFRIVILHGQEFTERLPTASTCTNTLFLPRYPSLDQLRSRLFIALRQGSLGFGLK